MFGFRGKFVQSKKPEYAQTVSYIDDDVTVLRQAFATVIRLLGLVGQQGATVNENQYGEILLFSRGFPNIYVKRVLGCRSNIVVAKNLASCNRDCLYNMREGVCDREFPDLHGHGSKMIRFKDPVPNGHVLRFLIAKISHGWSSVRDARVVPSARMTSRMLSPFNAIAPVSPPVFPLKASTCFSEGNVMTRMSAARRI